MQKLLITGTAGFIGYHQVTCLLAEDCTIVGLDAINDYYDPQLKYSRLAEHGILKDTIKYNTLIQSQKHKNYQFIQIKLEDRQAVLDLFSREKFDTVIHLAAQAGVRYSLTNPYAYIESNINGFMNILEGCRSTNVRHLVYASSSSVYGLNEEMPFSVHHNVDHPVSLYAASKKSNELMAHTYSYLYQLPCTGLRFFTVYGPWGRPDMALFIFTKAILAGQPIDVYNQGNMQRDFTYIDDITESITHLLPFVPEPNPSWSGKAPDPGTSPAPHRILNIGCNTPVKLMDFIHLIEKHLGKKAKMNLLPLQPGDVPATWADVSELFKLIKYKPQVRIEQGIEKFMDWYKQYYQV